MRRIVGICALLLTQPLLAQQVTVSPGAQVQMMRWAKDSVERFGCMMGENAAWGFQIDSILDNDPDPRYTARTHVVGGEGWVDCPPASLGRIHSHPDAKNCWYYFPGTEMQTSDAVSFMRGPFPIDAIICGTTVVYAVRDPHVHPTSALIPR